MTLPNSMFKQINPPKTFSERVKESVTWKQLICGAVFVIVGFVGGIFFILFWAGILMP